MKAIWHFLEDLLGIVSFSQAKNELEQLQQVVNYAQSNMLVEATIRDEIIQDLFQNNK